LKAPGFNPSAYELKTRFQSLGFQIQLVPLHSGGVRTHVEGGDAEEEEGCCGCVRVTGLRKSSLCKGEIRLAAATAATVVVPVAAPAASAALDAAAAGARTADLTLDAAAVRCRCDTCERGGGGCAS
jgi:hypothetical protein